MGQVVKNKALWGQNAAAISMLTLLAYFIVHAFVGSGSLQSLNDLALQESSLLLKAQAVAIEKDALMADVTRLQASHLDADYLDFLARSDLGLVASDDVVIFTRR